MISDTDTLLLARLRMIMTKGRYPLSHIAHALGIEQIDVQVLMGSLGKEVKSEEITSGAEPYVVYWVGQPMPQDAPRKSGQDWAQVRAERLKIWKAMTFDQQIDHMLSIRSGYPDAHPQRKRIDEQIQEMVESHRAEEAKRK